MFTRLSLGAMTELADSHECELLALPMQSARDVSPTTRHIALGMLLRCASSYAHAQPAYLAHFKVWVDALDIPAHRELAAYVTAGAIVHYDHLAWLALLGRPKANRLENCRLAEALEAARRFVDGTHCTVRELGDCGVTTIIVDLNAEQIRRAIAGAGRMGRISTTAFTVSARDLIEQAEELGPAAFAGFSWIVDRSTVFAERWKQALGLQV